MCLVSLSCSKNFLNINLFRFPNISILLLLFVYCIWENYDWAKWANRWVNITSIYWT
jgi:hypothetical protein